MKNVFPNDDESFSDDDRSSAIFWWDLPDSIWFKVIKRYNLSTKNCQAMILKLKSKMGDMHCVWTTQIIMERLAIYPESFFNDLSRSKDKLFIKSNGRKQSNEGNTYYAFRLYTKSKDKCFEEVQNYLEHLAYIS